MLLHLKLLKPAKTLLSDAKNITTSYLTAYLKKKRKKTCLKQASPTAWMHAHQFFYLWFSRHLIRVGCRLNSFHNVTQKHKMHSVTHVSYNGWQRNVPWNCVLELCSAHSSVNNRHWQLYDDITIANFHFLHSSCYTSWCSCCTKSNCLYIHDSSRVLQWQELLITNYRKHLCLHLTCYCNAAVPVICMPEIK